jgi:hypothetical protein
MHKKWYRAIRTQNERRQTGSRKDRDKEESGYQWARGKRRHLPTKWDDFPIRYQKSWKKKRKTQYHVGGRQQEHVITISEVGEFTFERYLEDFNIPYKKERLWYHYLYWSKLRLKTFVGKNYKEVRFTYWAKKPLDMGMIAVWEV